MNKNTEEDNCFRALSLLPFHNLKREKSSARSFSIPSGRRGVQGKSSDCFEWQEREARGCLVELTRCGVRWRLGRHSFNGQTSLTRRGTCTGVCNLLKWQTVRTFSAECLAGGCRPSDFPPLTKYNRKSQNTRPTSSQKSVSFHTATRVWKAPCCVSVAK